MENMKEYQISTHEHDEHIEIVITGKVAARDISDIQEKIRLLRAAKCDKILLDIRSLMERSADTWYHVRRPENATGKLALLDIPEHEHMKSRCENIAHNTPMKLKWFSDIEAAKEWLKRKEESGRHFNF